MHPHHKRGTVRRPRHHHPRPAAGRPPEGPEGRRHRGGRGRAPRGDVRAATLLLLADEPMHGYQLMQAIAERSGEWTRARAPSTPRSAS